MGVALPGRTDFQKLPLSHSHFGAFQAGQQLAVKFLQDRVNRLIGAAAQVHGDFDSATFELTFVKEPQAGNQEGDDRRSLVHRRRKIVGRPGLIVVFQESRQPVLIRHISPEVSPHRGGIPGQETIVETLIIAIVKALLHEGPLQIPVDFRHKNKARVFGLDPPDGLRPERFVHRVRTVGGQRPLAPGAWKISGRISMAMSQRTPSATSASLRSSWAMASRNPGWR